MKKRYSKKAFSWQRGLALAVLVALLGFVAISQSAAAKTTLSAEASMLSVPTVLSPVPGARTLDKKPLITGVTQNDTKVAVYIDEVYNGQATVKNHQSGTANFSYQPFLDLKPGMHKVQVRAENAAKRSKLSGPVSLEVERPYVAPTLFEPVVDETTIPTKPIIIGVAKDDSLIKVYIDGKLDGEVMVKNDSSGTGSFGYTPYLELDPSKDHLAYAVAYDKNGKESPYSNVVGFKVKPNKPKVAVVQEVDQEAVKEEVAEESNEEAAKEEAVDNISTTDGTTEEQGQVLGEVEEAPKEDPVATADEAVGETTEELTETGEEAVEEEATDDKEDSEEATEEDNGEEATDEEEESSNTSIIIWVIILVIVIILIVLSLRGGSDQEGPTSGEGTGNKPKDNNPTNEPSREGGNKEGGSGNMPPPPPSSSSY